MTNLLQLGTSSIFSDVSRAAKLYLAAIIVALLASIVASALGVTVVTYKPQPPQSTPKLDPIPPTQPNQPDLQNHEDRAALILAKRNLGDHLTVLAKQAGAAPLSREPHLKERVPSVIRVKQLTPDVQRDVRDLGFSTTPATAVFEYNDHLFLVDQTRTVVGIVTADDANANAAEPGGHHQLPAFSTGKQPQ